jgi:hypothetical protein
MVKYLQKISQICTEAKAIATAYPTAGADIGATVAYLGHNVKHTINDTANKIERLPTTSATRDIKGYYLGLQTYKNNLDFETTNFGMLANAVGTCTTTTTTHVLSGVNTPILPFFNLEQAFVQASSGDKVRTWNGCTIDNYTLSCAKDEALKTSIDYIAAYTYKTGAKKTITESTASPYMWHETRILFDLASAGAYTSGVELTNINTWNWKVSNKLIADGRCGSASAGNYITRPQGTTRNYELGLMWDLEKQTTDFYDLHDAATLIAYQVYVYRGASDYLKYTVENAQVLTAPDNMDGKGDLVPQTIKISGGQSDATTTNNQCVDAISGAGVYWHD